MKSLKTTLVLLAFMLIGFTQSFAQCGNKAINGGTQNPTVQALGQSFKVCSDLPGTITKITFQRCAWIRNEERQGTLKIFEGNTNTGNAIHTQNITLAALEKKVERIDVSIDLTAPVDYEVGKTYTFFIELNTLIVVGAHYGNPYADGNAFTEKPVNPSWDMYFDIGFEEYFCGNTIINPAQVPTIPQMGQSFKMCTDKPGKLTSITIQRLAKILNTERQGTLKIFKGEFEGANRDGDLMYSQNVTLAELPLSETKHDVVFKLEGGEGSLDYSPEMTYTFYLELNERILPSAHYGNPYAEGKGFMKVATNPSWDFYFKVGYAESTVKNTLNASEKLAMNETLTSLNGRYSLIMQTDGNLVIYDGPGYSKPTWASQTNGKGTGASLAMQTDGHLVLYNGGSAPIWASGTHVSVDPKYSQAAWKPVKAVLKDDGALVLISATGQEVWSSKK